MSDDTKQELSRAAYERLTAELNELQTIGRTEIAEKLLRARELGDLSENAEYHETKNQQGMMEARIRQLDHIIHNSVVTDQVKSADVADSGTFVTLRPTEGGDDEKYLLAQSHEERSALARTVTTVSPLGVAIGGRSIGDRVEYQAPGGVFTYEIVKIEPWNGE